VSELKEFQAQCINAVQQGRDVILVQPTGSGKSLCFTFSALLNPGKVCIVIEPVEAIINNQVEALLRKGIDVVPLGRTARSKNQSPNFSRVFQSSNLPSLAFCIAEYLFGAPSNGTSSGSSGNFHLLVEIQDRGLMVITDEAHKIFHGMPDYHPAFDYMKQLHELPLLTCCNVCYINKLKIKYTKEEYNVVVNVLCYKRRATKGVHRDNLQIRV